MTTRFSLTLGICVVAALIGIAALFLPGSSSSSPATAAAAPAAESHSAHHGDAAPAAVAPAAEAAPAAAGSAAVTIENFAFSGIETVTAGQVVTVTNVDSAPHTLTSVDGAFDTGLLQAGQSVEIVVPTTPGTYAFFCEVHPSMTGSFTVTA